MKSFFALGILLFGFVFAFAQNEQSPIVEKEIAYKNWTYKSVRTGEDVNLHDFAKHKKLTMVVYFAPWCGNWRHNAPLVEKFYEKYKANGLNVIGVAEYGSVAEIKSNLDGLKITFPVVYESESRMDREKTTHHAYRKATGDGRNWGSPWFIFLTPSVMEKKGDIVTKKTSIINGEMIEADGEQFIRTHLGLPAETKPALAVSEKIEACEAGPKPAEIVPPTAKKQ